MKKLLFFSVIVIAAVAVIAAVVDFCILKQKRSQDLLIKVKREIQEF